ncbi:hypothetical protein Glove_9g145 [Diversispora epigaea]|uniref:LisH domain-containing protein n=1 Tax=Diversispora epigaea TaxID=1348612 RepID=A0A397JNR7_9GLOM|nr:hypothetical protein Glove_9g145 [Diversispora epigaea]
MSLTKSSNYNNAIPVAHLLVLKFLETNKYYNALKEFRKEANQIIEENSEMFDNSSTKPLLAIVQDHLVDELKKGVENWNLDEIKIDKDLYSSETTLYPKYICETFSQIHSSNILAVRLHEIALSSYVDKDYETTFTPALITGSADKTIKFTSLLTGDTFNTFDFHNGGILAIDFHPIRSNLMLSASVDGSCVLMDAFTTEIKQTFNDHKKPVVRAKFSPDGLFIVTGSYDRTLNLYKTVNGSHQDTLLSPRSPIPSSSPLSPSTPLPIYSKIHSFTFESNVESLSFLPDSSFLIVGIRESNYLHYINLQQSQNMFEITKYNMNSNGDDWISFTAMDIIPSPNNNGKYLLVSTDDESGRIILFKTFNNSNSKNGKNRVNGVNGKNRVNCVNGKNDVNGMNRNKANGKDNVNGNNQSKILIQVANFYDTDIPSSSNILDNLDNLPASPVSFSNSSNLISRKLTNPRLLWHPTGNFFYSYGIDSNIRVYSLRTKKLIDQIEGHTDVVRGMWYDVERDLLVTCGFDKCIKIWCSDELSSKEATLKDLMKDEKMHGLMNRRNTIV